MTKMEIIDYSENSFVVRGDTKTYKDNLKELGGKWNANLRDGAGWVFSNKHKTKVEEFTSKQISDENEKNEEVPLSLWEYSEKSFVIRGDTKKYKDTLKELGGKWNSNLKDGAGWIFPNTKRNDVDEWLSHL